MASLGQQMYAPPSGRPFLTEDVSLPCSVVSTVPNAVERASNRGRMHVSEVLQRRVRVRVNPEVFSKLTTRSWAFHRLTRCFARMSFPNAQQAELFCDALLKFCESFNGVMLSPHSQTIEDKAVK